ncbi:HPr family phosphocarrier protein [Nesterenkonia massiliensis]|uniref:HPr family phosphocarrier protein n=2 Tax=Nesterenkonia TaxID=57494 RepID=A0ABP9FQM9_9MICC|nr:HPr family phosphocarrier protein [Nesterenkonia massiliensis]MCT1606454.1 HPr family phosphocarrier protein [Nesterenkonia massiliensis]
MSATRTVTVGSSNGLHARPAKLFVEAAQNAGVPVTITKGEKSVNAASILGVMSLGVEHGDEVVLTVEAENAEQTLDTLAELLTTNHDEAN